jgi:predicted esterase
MADPRNGKPEHSGQGGPHQGAAVVEFGAPLAGAGAAVILLHGRGATAENILGLAEHFGRQDLAVRAPQAAGNSWYPYSFLAPLDQNEPGLSSALRLIEHLLGDIGRQGTPPEKTVLAGFSQGACLALEFAARNPRRYGAVIGLSGGVIGPPGTTWNASGSLESTPVFLGCGDLDSHIPLERVHETTEVLRRLGAEVTERIYPGMGHGINEDEMVMVRQLLSSIG